jgi:hypothetical protein
MSNELDLRLTKEECVALMMMATHERPLGLEWLIDGTRLNDSCEWGIAELKKIRGVA